MHSLLYSLFPFLHWSKNINRETLKGDLGAGVTGAILVLPQGVAYALIAGLPPEFGLYTTIVSATLAAFFGSSMHMISGPTAALSIVAATVVTNAIGHDSIDYVSMMLTLTFMVGVIQLMLGLFNFGVLINFISHSVIQGFTSGAAIIIAASQITNLLGFEVKNDDSLIGYLTGALDNLQETNLNALNIALVTIITALILKKYVKRIPYLLGAMVLGTVFCFLINGSTKGVYLLDKLAGTLPPLSRPSFDYEVLSALFFGSFSVALLGLIEAASIARSIAMRSKQKIEGTQEFIGQGLSNFIGGFLSCYPSSGSFTRSGGNYDAGAKTPIASLFSALIVISFVLFFPTVTTYIPLPVMASMIMVITWNLFDIKAFISTIKSDRPEAITFIGTFFFTLCIPLEYAIYVGVFISIGLYLYKTSRPKITLVAPIINTGGERSIRSVDRHSLQECPEIKMIRIDGSLFFASSQHVQTYLQAVSKKDNKNIIVISKGINFIDATAQYMLINEIERIERKGGKIIFSSLKGNVYDDLEKTKLKIILDENRVFDSTSEAINVMIQNIKPKKCSYCPAKIFHDCPAVSKH